MNMIGNTVAVSASLSVAMERMGQLRHQFLVLLEEREVVGTLTDGDVRRALLRGVNLFAPVSEAMNSRPIVSTAVGSRAQHRSIMLRKNIRFLPIIDKDNNLIDIAVLDELSGDGVPQRALIMAGGLGQRLRPYTDTVPKPMLDIGGAPLLETLVRQLCNFGFRSLTISINYLGDQIVSHFGDGNAYGVEIDYITETERMGTVGAASLLKRPEAKPLLVMNGDILTTINFRALMDFHLSTGADMTMGVRSYKHQVPYGVVNTKGLNIVSIEEKPELDFFVNAGLYVIEPSVLARLRPEPRDMTDLVAELLSDPSMSVIACPVHEYWQDIGREQDLLNARRRYNDLFFLSDFHDKPSGLAKGSGDELQE